MSTRGSVAKTRGSEKASCRSGNAAEEGKRDGMRSAPAAAAPGTWAVPEEELPSWMDARCCWSLPLVFLLHSELSGPAPLGLSSWHRAW